MESGDDETNPSLNFYTFPDLDAGLSTIQGH